MVTIRLTATGRRSGRSRAVTLYAFPDATYQRRTKRTIPLFVIEPVAES
jgi:hypothetical protein